MQVVSLGLVLLLLDYALSAKDKNPMSETRTTSVRQAVMNPSMTLREPSGELCDTDTEFTFREKELVREEKPGDILIGWNLSFCRCLKNGVADVAFLDHLTVMSATGNPKNSIPFNLRFWLFSFPHENLEDMLTFLLSPEKIQSLKAVQAIYWLSAQVRRKQKNRAVLGHRRFLERKQTALFIHLA